MAYRTALNVVDDATLVFLVDGIAHIEAVGGLFSLKVSDLAD